jgi:hypothetical protein
MEAIDTRWRKSSYSGNGGNCVEVADRDSRMLVRDTKQHGHGPTLRFTPDAWKAFAKQLKSLASNKRKRPFPGNHLGGPFSSAVIPSGDTSPLRKRRSWVIPRISPPLQNSPRLLAGRFAEQVPRSVLKKILNSERAMTCLPPRGPWLAWSNRYRRVSSASFENHRFRRSSPPQVPARRPLPREERTRHRASRRRPPLRRLMTTP